MLSRGGGTIAATILTYHAINTCPRESDPYNLFISPETFAGQIAYLSRKASIVSLRDAVTNAAPQSRPAVAITFDDAYSSVLQNAVPVLERYGAPATTFLPTAAIGRASNWDAPSTCDFSVMSEAELKEASGRGMSIESHGHSHLDMSKAAYEEVAADLTASIERIASITGLRPRYLAYPYGRHTEVARRAAEECGFEAAFGIDAPPKGRFALGRVQVTPLDGPRVFAVKASGFYLALRWSRVPRAAYWIVKPLVRHRGSKASRQPD